MAASTQSYQIRRLLHEEGNPNDSHAEQEGTELRQVGRFPVPLAAFCSVAFLSVLALSATVVARGRGELLEVASDDDGLRSAEVLEPEFRHLDMPPAGLTPTGAPTATVELNVFDHVAVEIAGDEPTVSPALVIFPRSRTSPFLHSTSARLAATATHTSTTIRPQANMTRTSISTTSVTNTFHPSPPCDSCCPLGKQRPTVVITVFERDLCKMRVTAHSIVRHDPGHLLGKVIICWVSRRSAGEFADELDEIKSLLSARGEVEIMEIKVPWDVEGWSAQQSAKLKVASLVRSEYYVVLDAKNSLLHNVTEESFFTSCGQAKIFGRYEIWELPEPHQGWYRQSAARLGVEPMEWGVWPPSITPMVMHTETVLHLLQVLGEPREFGLCSGGLCGALDSSATEFTLYTIFAATKAPAPFDCIHAIEERQWGNEVAVSIRREGDAGASEMISHVRAIANHDPTQNGDAMFFGVQAGALSVVSGDERYDLLGLLAEVYRNAGLNWFPDWDSLAKCVG